MQKDEYAGPVAHRRRYETWFKFYDKRAPSSQQRWRRGQLSGLAQSTRAAAARKRAQ